MITLYQPPPAFGTLSSISPFCAKLETYLKIRGLPYESKFKNPMGSPKGKVPWVEIDGSAPMGDSGLIIAELEKKGGLDADLDPETRARGHVIRRMLEEHTYFGNVVLRWGDPISWPHVRDYFKALLPPVLGSLVVGRIRSGTLGRAKAQGVAKHSRDEIVGLIRDDLDALDALIGKGPYALGAKPTTTDATVYAFLTGMAWVPWDSEIKSHVLGKPNLVAYMDRIKQQYWS
jgi:glutathione S-transferase